MDRYKKIIIGVTAGGLIAGSIYLVYKQYCKRGSSKDADEGFSDSDDVSTALCVEKKHKEISGKPPNTSLFSLLSKD